MCENRENPSVDIAFEEKEAFDTTGQSRMVDMENVPGLEMGEPVRIQVEENMEILDAAQPSYIDIVLGWLEEHGNWLNITLKHVFLYIILSYMMNLIFFWVLSDNGRMKFAQMNPYSGTPAKSIWFLLCSLVVLVLGRLMQSHQTLLPATNNLMWYFSSSLKTYQPGDVFWPENRQLLIKKWNDWVLLSWLLTLRVISTPLRLKFPSLKAIKAKGLMTELEYQSILTEQRKKNLSTKDLSLVVFEWLVLLNEKSINIYKTPHHFKTILDHIRYLSFRSSSMIFNISHTISKLLIVFGTLGIYIFCFVSILGYNTFLFRNPPFKPCPYYHDPRTNCSTSFSTKAVVEAFVYPLLYSIPVVFFCFWFYYLRKTMEPYGWNVDDINVCKVFKRQFKKAQRLCHNTGADYSSVLSQVDAV